MSSLRKVWRVGINLLSKEKRDHELDDEIRSLAGMLEDEQVAQGMPAAEARRKVNLALGGVEQVKEQIRGRRNGASLDAFLQDINYGARMLRKKPGFTVVAVATLALGIGANTAIFSVVNATLLTPIAIPSPERVVLLWTENPAHNFHHFPASVPDFYDWKSSGIFSHLAAFNNDGFNIRIGNQSERVEGLYATSEWFAIQGRKALLGRTFRPDETIPGHSAVVVLGWEFWNRHFEADRRAIGKSIVVNGALCQILGILPKGVPLVEHEEVYVPAVLAGPEAANRGTRSWLAVGRIADGLSLAAAQRRMDVISNRLAKEYPAEDGGATVHLQPVEEAFVEDFKALLIIVFGAVGFVLLIACANIANLLLVRGTARRREIAIRVAVGAGRSRIFHQLLSESMLLTLLGAGISILPAFAGIHLIPKIGATLPNLELIRLDAPVLLFALGLALLTGVLFSLVPAFQFWNTEANQPLREAERGQVSRHQNRTGSLFVIAQVAFTLVLLAGAGLMLRSFLALRDRNPGYDVHHALAMNIALTGSQFGDPAKRTAFLERALEQVDSLPGVEIAGIADSIAGGDTFHGKGLHFADRPDPPPNDVPVVLAASVSPGYFRAMHVPLWEGRIFTSSDKRDQPLVAMIDEISRKKYWPHENPIGKKIKLEKNRPLCTIVGVTGSVEQNAALQAVMGEVGQVYLPFAQNPSAGVSLVVRGAAEPSTLSSEIRGALSGLDRDVPIYQVQTLAEARAKAHAPIRLGTLLLILFGSIALLLASVGIYGVVSYTVGVRIREFGIRAAMGAGAWELMKLSLGKALRLIGTGAILGLFGAFALTRLMRAILSGISTYDPTTFATATLILLVVGLAASYVPVRRASRVDPTITLRAE